VSRHVVGRKLTLRQANDSGLKVPFPDRWAGLPTTIQHRNCLTIRVRAVPVIRLELVEQLSVVKPFHDIVAEVRVRYSNVV
jgi:hypothetical protein